LRLSTGSERREVGVDGSRPSRFAPITTDHVTLTVLSRNDARAFKGFLTPVPTAVAEVELAGLEGLRSADLVPSARVQLPCGAGPDVIVDGVRHATAAEGDDNAILLAR
jgi:hypothetical protein